jgi:hypothetical protein
MAGEDALTTALAGLWAKNRDRVLTRANAVLDALDAAAAGQPADLAAAARESHVLAGALGTYGRAGSEVFAEAETAMAASGSGEPEAADLEALARRVREVVAAL